MIDIIKKGKNAFTFSLKAKSGQALLHSIEFETEDEIKKTIHELGSIRESHDMFERKTNFDGKFLFNLKNTKGKLVGQSELYNSEAGMENGIKNLRNRLTTLADLDEL